MKVYGGSGDIPPLILIFGCNLWNGEGPRSSMGVLERRTTPDFAEYWNIIRRIFSWWPHHCTHWATSAPKLPRNLNNSDIALQLENILKESNHQSMTLTYNLTFLDPCSPNEVQKVCQPTVALCYTWHTWFNMCSRNTFGTTLTNQNSIQKEIKSRLKSGNACYYSVQNLLSSSFLSRNIKIYRTIILPVVLYGCETLSLT